MAMDTCPQTTLVLSGDRECERTFGKFGSVYAIPESLSRHPQLTPGWSPCRRAGLHAARRSGHIVPPKYECLKLTLLASQAIIAALCSSQEGQIIHAPSSRIHYRDPIHLWPGLRQPLPIGCPRAWRRDPARGHTDRATRHPHTSAADPLRAWTCPTTRPHSARASPAPNEAQRTTRQRFLSGHLLG